MATVSAPNQWILNVPTEKSRVFRRALSALATAGTPYSVGGGLALYYYTGISREAHDFDAHMRPSDVEAALRALRAAGFEARVKHAGWLAQAWLDNVQVDLVFGQGSWHDSVTDSWLDGPQTSFFDHLVRIVPPEEFFYSKAMRCSRMRYDAPDLFHLLAAAGDQLDWDHLVALFGDDWEVLLSHLIMYRYVFPSLRRVVPDRILDELLETLEQSRTSPQSVRVCRGTLLDTSGPYRQDIDERGFIDDRVRRWQQRRAAEPALRRLETLSANPIRLERS